MKEDNTYYDGMDGLNLPGSLRVNPFMVPENYFGQLSSSILSQVSLERLSNAKNTGFSVPKAYFSQLTENIQFHINMEQYKNIARKEEQEEFNVPTGYFENLSEHIQTKIFEEKLKRQIPVDGFTMPEGYVGVLQDKIVAQTTKDKKQKTVVWRLNFNKWIPYVAAACVAVVIGFVSYNNINNNTRESFNESHLSSLPEDEIINYLSASYESQDMLYLMDCLHHAHDAEGVCIHVQENDIEDYLNYAL